MRLVIGGPTLSMVPASFVLDLVRLLDTTKAFGPWVSVTVGLIASTYVHVGREAFLEGAIKQGASHVLWLDTDMAFPDDTALRLAQHHRPVVACNCVMRDPRLLFTAERQGQRIATEPTSIGLESVDSVGFAVLLMRTDMIADLPRPWFRHGHNTETGADIGEDRMFCRALRAAGHEIYIDHDLSKEIGHIGQYTYRPVGNAALAV